MSQYYEENQIPWWGDVIGEVLGLKDDDRIVCLTSHALLRCVCSVLTVVYHFVKVYVQVTLKNFKNILQFPFFTQNYFK